MLHLPAPQPSNDLPFGPRLTNGILRVGRAVVLSHGVMDGTDKIPGRR